MTLIVKVPGVSFTQPLPKLYRDAVIGPATLAAYDSVNAVSWPKQALPGSGSPSADKWVNLINGTADGLFYQPGDITFNRGFVMGSSGVHSIQLLNGAIPAAPSKVLGIVWVKHGTQVGTTQDAILNLCRWAEIRMAQAAQTNVAAGRYFICGTGSANREIPIGAPLVGTVYQLAVYYESVTRIIKAYVNGVEVFSGAGFADMAAGTDGVWLGSRGGIGASYVGTYFRSVVDILTDGRTAAEVVALDYALNNGRFS